MELIIKLMRFCDLIAISDGVSALYAIGYASRDKEFIEYVEGDDFEALLNQVLQRVSES